MSLISDQIEAQLKTLLHEGDGMLEFSRRALAAELHCVPSQISYVISTRFTSRQGYQSESRRGGGGYIRLRKIHWLEPAQILMHSIHALPDALSQSETDVLLGNLRERGALDERTASLLMAAVSDSALRFTDIPQRNRQRAHLLSRLLCALLTEVS